MASNFIALLAAFKSARASTFLLACDTAALYWLQNRFRRIVEAESDTSFVIGDGIAIASDNRCKLSVVRVDDDNRSEIQRCNQLEFTWHIGREQAALAAEKILSLAASNVPAHQYLEPNCGHFRAVVITKDEYPLDTIRAMRDGRPAAV
jgi:hypothetical protein